MRASQILLFSWELRCDKEERQLEIARDILKEALWIIVLLLLFPSIWFYPLHNKKPCWLLYCLGFCACPSHSECQCNAGLQKQVRLWPRVGPGLSKYDVNHNRTQTCSVLRGQVPFPYKKPRCQHGRSIWSCIMLHFSFTNNSFKSAKCFLLRAISNFNRGCTKKTVYGYNLLNSCTH